MPLNQKQLTEIGNAQFRYYLMGPAYRADWFDTAGNPIGGLPMPAETRSAIARYTSNNALINDPVMIANYGLPRPGDRIGRLVPGANDSIVEVTGTNPPSPGFYGATQEQLDQWLALNAPSDATRVAELEKRITQLEAENRKLKAALAGALSAAA